MENRRNQNLTGCSGLHSHRSIWLLIETVECFPTLKCRSLRVTPALNAKLAAISTVSAPAAHFPAAMHSLPSVIARPRCDPPLDHRASVSDRTRLLAVAGYIHRSDCFVPTVLHPG